jgi:hypothetical protein
MLMTTTTFIFLIIALLAPSTYQRLRFRLQPDYFYKLTLRKKVGLQIHHGHWGLLWIFVTSVLFIFGYHASWIIVWAGFGWGLLLDEIIPNLKTPSDDRGFELELYKKSTRGTMILIGTVAIIFILLFVATR